MEAGLNGQKKGCLYLLKMIHNKYILFAFRVVVGGVFIWAGFIKISDPLGFTQSIIYYRVFPPGMSFFLALVLPWIEIICGFFLIFGVVRQASSFLLSCLLVLFMVLIAVTILRGIDIDCGCFGSLSQKVDYKIILTDSILLFFSLNIFFQKKVTQ